MNTNLQRLADQLARDLGISDDFRAATEHPYSCRCDKCLAWWAKIGPEEAKEMPDAPLTYGPFSEDEIRLYLKRGNT